MGNRAALIEVLRACVKGKGVGEVAARRPEQLGGLAQLAIEHGIGGIVHQCVHELPELPAEDRRQLAVAALQNRVHHEHIASDLRYLANVLEPLPSPWLIVKGPAVASTLYTPPEIRNAGDIDLLVEPEQFARAVELLEGAGHPVDDANWPLVRRLTAGQLHILLPRGTFLDLHWHLLFDTDERRRFPLKTSELVRRRRSANIAGLDLLTLDPVDTLIHLCYHAAKEGADRLSWLSDIARAAAVADLDWDAVVTRTNAWNMALPVGTVLQRTRQQLGAPIPSSASARLLPVGWSKLMSLLDRIFPVAGTSRSLGNPASLLARSSAVANTPLRASTAAVSGIARRAMQLAQTGTATRVDPSTRHDTPSSLQYRAQLDGDERAAYFAAVASEGESPGAAV